MREWLGGAGCWSAIEEAVGRQDGEVSACRAFEGGGCEGKCEEK